MKVLCVLNPISAGGLPIQRWPQVVSILNEFGIDYELLANKEVPLDAQLMDRLEKGDPDEFVAIAGIGGDGTQSAAINALMRFKQKYPGVAIPPYGFIPMGVGNDIAKSFGLTARSDLFVDDVRRSVSTLAHGADYQLDLGRVKDCYFADALTIGLDSQILRERNRRKRKWDKIPLLRRLAGGPLLYTLSTSIPIWRHRALDAEITVDGIIWYSGPILNLIVNNTRIYAGEFDFCTNGHGNDGLLDVIIFTGHTDYLSKFLLSYRHNPRDIRKMATRLSRVASHTQGKAIRVVMSKAQPAQVDGEEIEADREFVIAVVPQAIHIKTPAEP
jgi:diacylglycerol kinase family enzyme